MPDVTSNSRTQSFTLFYDSKDKNSPLANHEMDLASLTEVLDGMKGMFETANYVINGSEEELDVRVKAGFEKGSFGIIFELFSSPEAIDILKFIGISSAGLFASSGMALEVIKELRGRSIDIVESGDDDKTVNIKVDGQVISCDRQAKKLVTNERFRNSVARVFTGAGRASGLDEIGLKFDKSEKRSVISIDQAKDLRRPENLYKKEVSTEVIDEAKVKFLTAHADKQGGWRVEYLGQTIKVEILDAAFLQKLSLADNDFSFGKTFRVNIQKTTTSRVSSKRESKTYKIIKVLREV